MIPHITRFSLFPAQEPRSVLPPRVAEGERVYAIGDIHGRHDLLMRLMTKILIDAGRFADGRIARLIFLGDYIDRGDDSRAVLDALTALDIKQPTKIGFLLGNHEAALLDFLEDPERRKGWLEFGAEQTLASYGVSVSRFPDAGTRVRIGQALFEQMGPHVNFLKGLQPMARSGDVIFSHAGFDPSRDAQNQLTRDLIWGHRDFLSENPVPGQLFVHGHYDAPTPTSHTGRICVDTGAYYSGILTAVRLDEGQAFLSVNALK